MGGDDEISSDFQLIAATNRDLTADVLAGKFREDLLARINLWTFRLPGLAERREDIEPNVEYELRNFAEKSGQKMTFAKDARQRFLDFARSPDAAWKANFRDLNASIIRMATLSRDDRIRTEMVEHEIERLRLNWNAASPILPDAEALESVLGHERATELDSFDAVQLAHVLKVCRESKTLAEAGRKLFQHSRMKKKSKNDTDRVSKYLAGFGLNWDNVAGAAGE